MALRFGHDSDSKGCEDEFPAALLTSVCEIGYSSTKVWNFGPQFMQTFDNNERMGLRCEIAMYGERLSFGSEYEKAPMIFELACLEMTYSLFRQARAYGFTVKIINHLPMS